MMTPQSLERASQAFRRGYRDGYAARQANPYPLYTFAWHDWKDGHEAAANEMFWDEKALKLRRNMGRDD